MVVPRMLNFLSSLCRVNDWRDATAHAELVALQNLGPWHDLQHCEVFVTCEPCIVSLVEFVFELCIENYFKSFLMYSKTSLCRLQPKVLLHESFHMWLGVLYWESCRQYISFQDRFVSMASGRLASWAV